MPTAVILREGSLQFVNTVIEDPELLWPQTAAELRSAWTLRLRSGQAREGGRPHTSTSNSFNHKAFVRWRIRERNSVRVSSSLRKQPSMDDVTAEECCFSTPRIIMQR